MTPTPSPLFPDVAFHEVLSLGADCEAANGLRLLDRHGIRGLFDWLVTPLDAVAAILADDGARLAERFVAVQNGTSARCDAYGVLYHHELPRDAENQIVFSSDLLAVCRSKLRHKMESFRRACEDAAGPILFLRVGPATDLPWDRFASGACARASDFDDLALALGRRFPRLDFRLLVVTIAPVSAAGLGASTDPRVAFVDLPRRDEGGWRVSEDDWRSLFAGLEFAREVRGNRTIGETLYWFGIADLEATRVESAASSTDKSVGSLPQDDLHAATVEELYASGAELLRIGQSFRALERWEAAFARGHRDLSFLRDYLGLLTGETRYDDVLRKIDLLRKEGVGTGLPRVKRHLAMLSGHAKLALAQPRDVEIKAAIARAEGKAWLDPETLRASIASAIAAQRPFAFIRLGDGEARFLLSQVTGAGSVLDDEERHAMGDVVWENWFGDPLSSVPADTCSGLATAFIDAVASADVVGACTPERLSADTGHYGYLVWQERWLRQLFTERPDMLFADAMSHRRLNADMPFLAALLEGLDVLGVVSPHRGLADALGKRLRIPDVRSHVVPGEGRLPSAQAARASGRHFPEIYESLLGGLAVPRPGCVFLVAAGLLGKIYCSRIKTLGGIALDVGALVDAWMGFDTRDGQFADVAKLQQQERTIACLSMHKTGSMALVAALRQAGFSETLHSHCVGPRSIAMHKKMSPRTVSENGLDVRPLDPSLASTIVTCVRDPIAQLISAYFQFASVVKRTRNVDLPLDRDGCIAWIDQYMPDDYTTWWMDDNLLTTFGFDFREHPFDFFSKSLRFTSSRLRLLCLRFEDPTSSKEAALGWLLERDRVALPEENRTADKHDVRAYAAFTDAFIAPRRWLETFYEAAAIRHFYTQWEVDAFKERWAERPLGHSCPHGVPSIPPIPASPSTAGCISFGKTGSMALADAVREAGFPDAVHLHYLGPRAIAIKRNDPEPMLDLAIKVAGRIADPVHDFRLVTAVRDPIARILSQAFYRADSHREVHGIDIVRDRDALIAWWEATPQHRLDVWTMWFDDTFKTTFGFDFREHPFDHERRSLRFASDRLRLLVLRQEDERRLREAELGWLLEREGVALRSVNDAANQGYLVAYQTFLRSFVAPAAWLDAYYENEVVKHFYTEQEREAFRARWSDR